MEEKIKKNIVIFNQLCLNLFEKTWISQQNVLQVLDSSLITLDVTVLHHLIHDCLGYLICLHHIIVSTHIHIKKS
jgi:hypothetical protein